MKQHLEAIGFDYTRLTSLASSNSIARYILTNYESPTYGRGYSGYSMSVNAIEAQNNGSKPLSKWKLQDCKEFNEIFNTKYTLKQFKELLRVWGYGEEHHSSKFYNVTEYFAVHRLIRLLTKGDLQKLQNGELN